MTPGQPVLYAAALLLALACLLRWKFLRDLTPKRVQRSLRVYLMKRSAEFTLSRRPQLETA